jgi:hypothetical protein
MATPIDRAGRSSEGVRLVIASPHPDAERRRHDALDAAVLSARRGDGLAFTTQFELTGRAAASGSMRIGDARCDVRPGARSDRSGDPQRRPTTGRSPR